MRRKLLVLVCLLAAVGGAAVPARAGSTSGTILLPAPHPFGQQQVKNILGGPNGVVGWAVQIPTSSTGYTLTKTTSAPAHLDAYFYRAGPNDQTVGPACTSTDNDDAQAIANPGGFAVDSINDPLETGQICPGAEQPRWAIVVVRSGANVGFTLTY